MSLRGVKRATRHLIFRKKHHFSGAAYCTVSANRAKKSVYGVGCLQSSDTKAEFMEQKSIMNSRATPQRVKKWEI